MANSFQVYQKNKLPEALDYYNQSILLAPHPPPPNMFMMPGIHEQPSEEGFPHEELALGFANRSAVLFQVLGRLHCVVELVAEVPNGFAKRSKILPKISKENFAEK